MVVIETDFELIGRFWFGAGKSRGGGGSRECGDETSGSLKWGGFLDQLRIIFCSRRDLLHETS